MTISVWEWRQSTNYNRDAELSAKWHEYVLMLSCIDVNINDCRPVSQVNSDTVAHVYDIWISNNHDIMVYTDWKSEAVNMLSLTTGTLLNPLATGLMRPSQLLFVGSQSTCRFRSVWTAICFVVSRHRYP